MLRKLIFWSHLVVGIVAGLVVFILCLTGAILAFEMQVIDRAESDPRARPATADAEPLPPAAIAASVSAVEKGRIISQEWFADPEMPVRVTSDKRKFTLVNGYTGEVLGRGAVGVREFMRWITDLHVSLVAGIGGVWAVAIANACFVFLILSGLWLWWPRQWRWNALRSVVAVRFDLRGRARDWNWHTTLGFWFLPPLLFIAATGVDLSFRPVDQWWRGFASAHVLGATPLPTKISDSPADAAKGWPQWMRLVQQRYPGWRSIVVSGNGAPNNNGLLAFTVNLGTPRQVRNIFRLTLDTRSGQLLEEKGWANLDASSRARSIVRLGHTGEILGLGGQILGFLACLAGCLLVYTGLALSWRRFFGKSAITPPDPTSGGR